MRVDQCVADLLLRGLADWIDAAEVASVARTVGGARTEHEVRELSLQLLRELLGRGLMEVGAVTESGFEPWRVAVDRALERIESEWRSLPKGPDLGDICWLNLTEKGQTRAEELRSRNSREKP
jgi:hypothetical protein